MPLSIESLERRADRLLAQWDAIEFPYDLPQREFQKAERIIHEASIICMCLSVMNEKCKQCKNKQEIKEVGGCIHGQP